MPAKNGNEVRVERLINCTPQSAFQALSEGRLFVNCGAASGKLEISFRVGGSYKAYFTNADVVCCGKFLEIVPDRKIVFTWGDQGSDEGFPMTRVAIEIKPEANGSKTKLLIVHTGFETQEDADAHNSGWCAGLDDLTGEITQGKLRILREFPVTRDVLYSLCKDPLKFFAPVAEVKKGSADFRVGGKYRFPTEAGEILGEFQEIVPGKKIAFSWLSDCDQMLARPAKVTLMFEDEEDGDSSIELVHEGLPLGESTLKHRHCWEHLLAELKDRLK